MNERLCNDYVNTNAICIGIDKTVRPDDPAVKVVMSWSDTFSIRRPIVIRMADILS